MSNVRSIRNTWKILVLQLRYSARQFFKYTMSRAAFLLFLVAFVMLLIATLPQLRVRVQGYKINVQGYKINKERIETLDLAGSVYEEVPDKNGKPSLKPIAGAVVEIGGFRVSTNPSGRYELQFYSSTLDDIPVVLNHGGTEDFERITFLPRALAVQKDFIIR